MKKTIAFTAHRRVYAIVSLCVIAIALICSFAIGVELDISFKGGTLVKYSYTGTLAKAEAEALAAEQLGSGVTVDMTVSGSTQILSLSKADVLSPEQQDDLLEAFQTKFADNDITSLSVNALEASMGRRFFVKCLVAVALAAVFLILYIGLRFRKIGGVSAALTAIYALLNDLLVAYLAFVIFRIPLNDNFVAVILTILGYSLNDTIVIFDRIRENRGKMSKEPITRVVDLSLNQSFGRTLSTSISTITAMACVAIVALVMNLESVVSLAVPMLFGLLSGFYTSTCLCPTLWTYWVEHKERKAQKQSKAQKQR